MRVTAVKSVVWAVVFAFLMCVLLSVGITSVSADEDLWSSGFSAEIVDDSRDFKYGHPCEEKDVKDVFRSYNSASDKYIYTYQDRTTNCGFYTDFGFTDGSKYVLAGTDLYAHDIAGGSVAYTRHYPNNVFMRLSDPTRWTSLTYYTSNVFKAVPDHYTSVGSGSILRKHISDIYASDEEEFEIAYADSTALITRSYNTSENGRYIVFADYYNGVFVHDTLTKTYKTVSKNLIRGVGNIAVSNDGNTVVHYDSAIERTDVSGRTRALLVYDAAACTQIVSADSFRSDNDFSSEGCVQIDLTQDVYDLLGELGTTVYTGMENSYIEPRNGYVQGIFSVKRPEDANTVKKTVRFTPVNAPEASGYLAMGDSYSSGEGDGQGGDWYEPGTDEHGDDGTFLGRNLCHVSRRSYPYLLAKRLSYLPGGESVAVTPSSDASFHSVACSGAVMHNVVGGSLYGEDQGEGDTDDFTYRDNQYRFNRNSLLSVWQQGATTQTIGLSKKVFAESQTRSFNPEVITLGIGGNDAGFSDKVEACSLPGTCPFAVVGSEENRNVAYEIANLKYRLSDTYSKVKREASEDTRIYVHGYPVFIDDSGSHSCSLNTPFDEYEVEFIAESIRYVNSVAQAAAQEAGVQYVDVSNVLQGYELCSGVTDENSMMNGATAGDDISNYLLDKFSFCGFRNGCLGNESFHPTSSGHAQYAAAIQAQTANFEQPMPDPTATVIPFPNEYFGTTARVGVAKMNERRISASPLDFPLSYSDKTELNPIDIDSILLKSHGFAPGSNVLIEVHSDPIEIGTFSVDEDGALQTEVTMPEDLEPGYHNLHVYGVDAYGQEVDAYSSFFVALEPGDVDGDGALNEEDSCPVLTNSGIDADGDGLDDVCDSDVQVVVLEEEGGEENENEGEVLGNTTGLIKGEPNPETVAGTLGEPPVGQGQVLGATTESSTFGLSETGQPAGVVITVGFLIIISGIMVRRKPTIYYAQEITKQD